MYASSPVTFAISVQRRAERMDGDQVDLLDRGGVHPGHAERIVSTSASGFGAAPVMAHTLMPSDCARSAAASTFSLRPLADSSRSVSPGRPCAATWRAKASAAPKSLQMAVRLDVSACRAMADSGCRSATYLPTSSAVRCWASAALPPFPAASRRCPASSGRASSLPQRRAVPARSPGCAMPG